MEPHNQIPERDHQDSVKRCVDQIGPVFVRECFPNERARQDALRWSAFHDLMNPNAPAWTRRKK